MIRIKDRFCPFSHTPGTRLMIPCSLWGIEAYPTELKIMNESQEYRIVWGLTGPVKGFTVELDLEKNRVRIFGRALEGYFHFEVVHESRGIFISLKRGKSVAYEFAGKKGVLDRHQFLELAVEAAYEPNFVERLSLGMNKKLDWDLVLRREDVKEILPVLFLLGQKSPPWDGESFEMGTDLLLFIKRQFCSILFPLRKSERRLGLSLTDLPSHVPITAILRKSYEHIRGLFIQENGGEVAILPHLPKEFVAGRLVGIRTSLACIDLEWTKGKLRNMKVEALHSGVFMCRWPKEIEGFRLRHYPQERGKMISSSDEIVLSPGQVYYLDKFQK